MGEVVTATPADLPMSIRQLARVFDVGRDYIKARLTAKPVGMRGGHPVYKLSDVTDFHGGKKPSDFAGVDPELLPPDMKAKFWQAEDLKQAARLKQRKNQLETRELIPAIEVEIGLSNTFKRLAIVLDTLPDVLERDAGLPPEAVEMAITIMDNARSDIHESLKQLAASIDEQTD